MAGWSRRRLRFGAAPLRSGPYLAAVSLFLLTALWWPRVAVPEAGANGGGGINEAVQSLVFVTEDYAAVVGGCDAITSYSLNSRTIQRRGETIVSPGRMALLSDLSSVVAVRSNGLWPDFPQRSWDPATWHDLYIATINQESYEQESETYIDTVPVTARLGAIAAVRSTDSVLVATMSHDDGRFCRRGGDGPDHSISRFVLSEADWEARVVEASMPPCPTGGLAAEIVLSRDGDTAHVLAVPYPLDPEVPPHVVTVDVPSMTEIAARVAVDVIGELPIACAPYHASVGLSHMAVSPDDRYAMVNTWRDGRLSVVDLRERISTTVEAPGLSKTGGVSFNYGPENPGLLAVHGVDRVGIYSWAPPDKLALLSLHVVDPPVVQYGPREGNPGVESGPVASVVWSGLGDHLIAAGSHSGTSEFVVLQVAESGRRLTEVSAFEACPWTENSQNDIVTGNGLLPTYTPTPSLTPAASNTPTQSPTPAPSETPPATPTRTPLPTATHTLTPEPVFMPMALKERCDTDHQRADIALVLDTSSSMTGRKLEDAKAAALLFVGVIDLEPGRSQVAVVRYDREAEVVQELTRSQALIEAAIRSLRARSGTHIDKGLRAALSELQGPRHIDRNSQAMILLTDGLHTGTPGEELRAAAEVRAAGVRLYTIGLGSDVDEAALKTMAGDESRYYPAPDSADLARIYGEIAQDLMCPGKELWGGR